MAAVVVVVFRHKAVFVVATIPIHFVHRLGRRPKKLMLNQDQILISSSLFLDLILSQARPSNKHAVFQSNRRLELTTRVQNRQQAKEVASEN